MEELTVEEEKMMQEGIEEEPVKAEEPPEPKIEEPAEEPVKEPVKEEKQEQKFVPHAALHQARMEIKELREKVKDVDELKQEFINYRKSQEPKPPTYDESPLDWTKQKIEEVEHRTQQAESINQETQRQLALQNVVNQVSRMETEFRTKTPDYNDALAFTKDLRTRELQAIGLDDTAIQQELQQNILFVTVNAMKAGKNPVEAIYNIAKQYGYKGKSPKANEASINELETVAKGQEMAGKTLSGGTKDMGVTVEAMLEASDEDFDNMWDKWSKIEKKR